ncbi:MAG: ATP-binding protein, partial [Bacteroidota bacterium]
VTAIEKEDKGHLWAGTWGSGLNQLNADGTFDHFFVGGVAGSDSEINPFVSSLLYDERGFLLIGTEGNLALLNTETEEVFSLGDGALSQITEIGCLLKDHSGFFWVGTRNGLFRFPAEMLTPHGVDTSVEGKVTKFTTLPSEKNNTVSGLAGDYVISLAVDHDGNIWAGTYGNGVSCIRKDDNDQWLFTNYGVEEGLCNDVVYGILEDQNGRLWMSTDQGLSRFEKSDSAFLNYYTEDGLLSNQFYWSAAHKSDDGFLYFGNVKGLNYFNPRSFPDYPFKPKVVINGLRIFNQPVETGEKRHNKVVLSHNIFLTDTISLSYKDNVITFEFSAIDYFHPRKIRYAYKLSGVDKDWIEMSGDQRFANYTNLDGGTYQLRVKAAGSNGEWDDSERVLTLIIRPPFWQTTWFKFLLMGLIVSLALLYARHHARRLRMQKRTLENMVRERTRQIEEQKNQLQDQALELSKSNEILEQRQKLIEGQKNELESKTSKILDQRNRLISLNKKVKAANQSKLRFFTNVSHEFRTPLTLILAPLENLLEDDSLPLSVKDALKTIDRNARRLLMLINQLLAFRKIEAGKSSVHVTKGNAEQFLQEIYEAFCGLAQDRDITFNARIELLPKEVWFDGEKLEHIVYNLLSNAFKYTHVGGEVGFFASVEKQNDIQQLIISISDSGPGIPEKDAEKIFDRFYRVEEGSESYKGSGIGLALAKELAQAMHGNIQLKSAPQQGTTFVVSLPCSRNAFSEDELELSTQEVALSDEMKEKVQVIRDELTPGEPVNNEDENIEDNRSVVLVVEDNRELGNLIKQSFENTYDVLEAQNGREAYEIAKKNHVDLVISDIMMPEMDGISLCDRMKKNIYTSHIPVILLSARTLVKHQLEGLKTGADDYIGKPFSMRILREKARNLIESRKKLRVLFSNGANNEEVVTEGISTLDQQFINKAYQILEEHFSNPDFNVEGFADLMFVSRSLLYKKIKALAGLSPNDFITVFRLKKSIGYLTDRNLSIIEVAFKAGFNDPKYFSRVFKKFYHKTPSQFIK